MNAVFASLHKNPFSLSQGGADLLTTEEEEASAKQLTTAKFFKLSQLQVTEKTELSSFFFSSL